MPRSSRYIVLAAFGWLALAAANDTQPIAASNQAQAEQSIANSLANIAAIDREQAERAKGSKDTEPCEQGDDRRYSDLCAQWKAADAATLAAWLSGASFAAVLAALWFAFRSNWIARDTAKRQLRAYLSVEPHGVNEAIDGVHMMPTNIINNGQTPAYQLEIAGDILVFIGDPRQFDPKKHGRINTEFETAISEGALGPHSNQFTYAYAEAELLQKFAMEICDKKGAIIHYGRVYYTDIFGIRQSTGFAFYHWGEEWSDAESKRCRFGNDAT